MKGSLAIQDNRNKLFVVILFFATVFMGWQLWVGRSSSNLLHQWPTFIVLILVTLTLLWWLPNPIARKAVDESSQKGKGSFFIIVVITCLLFALPVLFGANILWFLPPLAGIILVAMRNPLTHSETLYALILSVISSIAAYWAGWISQFTPQMWSILQFFLVLTSCITGWKLMRHSGLLQKGIGQSCVLTHGVGKGLHHFFQGFLIALPWALGIVMLGASRTETWVQLWWHPLTAIQPAISEEAWGRLFLVPLVYYLTRRQYKPRVALTVALVIVGYWFAFLHTVGTPGALINTIFTGTLYVLPVSYLCMYKDLETAIGYHYSIDFIKFLSALILFKSN